MGFEPTIRYERIPVFETGAFNRSATPPIALETSHPGSRISTTPLHYGGARFSFQDVLWTTLLVLAILYLIGLMLSVGGDWIHALPVTMGLLVLYRLTGIARRG